MKPEAIDQLKQPRPAVAQQCVYLREHLEIQELHVGAIEASYWAAS